MLCRCDRDQACHADVLLNALRDTQKEGPEYSFTSIRSLVEFIDDGLPNKLVFKEDVKEAAGDESREGWRGIGALRRAHYTGRDRPYADGGGLCSPRRWPKASRRLPGGFAMELLDQARRGCHAAVKEASGGTDGVLDFMVKLSLGRMSGPPFPERHLAQIREWVANRLTLEARTVRSQ